MGASNSRFLIGAALAGITAMPVPVAMAQGEATRSAAAASDFRLEEIVVTSRKREENLQDAGFSVSALGRADLERRPDIDLSSFENAAPNVIITDMQEGPGNPASMTIRGIGTSDHERSIDPTVGVVVDGVFIGTVGGAMVKALDVERLEILRGPQGTLFGRNAIGGALLLDRVKPDTADFSGKMRGGYGNYDSVQLDAYVNVPLADRFAVKVGGAYSRHDGYFYNTFLDRRQGEDETRSINVAALLKPTDNIELYYRFDRQWIDQDAAVMHNVAAPNQVWCFFYNQCAVDGKTPQAGDRYRSVQNDPDFDAFFNSSMHIFTANWQISDGYSIDYLFGRFSTNEDAQWDFDGTPLTLYHTNRPQKYEQNSHELRLSYASPRLNYTVGVYLYDAKYRIENLSTIGFGDLAFGLPPGTIFTTLQIVQQKTDSYAVFFEGDYSFTDAFTLTLGGRYTDDKKKQGVDDPLFPELQTAGSIANPVSESWEEFTPKVGLRYRFSDDFMVFGLYSRGFRAGGFSGRPGTYEAVVTPYDPETVDNFEIGFKSQWFDDRLRVNATAYYMEYKDKQEELSVPVNIVGGTGQQTLFLNAATAELKGFEVEVAAQIFRGFSLTGMFGYLDAKYTDFDDPLTGESLEFLKLRRAPKVTFTVSPTYTIPVLNGELTLSADWHYVSAYEGTFWNTPAARNDAAHVVDAQIAYHWENTTFALYGRNLTKDDSYTIGLDVGRDLFNPGLWTFVGTRPPRTYGAMITHRF